MEIGGIEALRAWRERQKGTVALVPTMGALHSGHRALMDRARESADHLVVTAALPETEVTDSGEVVPDEVENVFEIHEMKDTTAK